MQRLLALAKRILAIRSGRGASFVISLLALPNKCLGYLRTLLVAYFFGATGVMDAFYMASSVIGLLLGVPQGALESSVLPHLARAAEEKEGSDRDLAAVVWWLAVLLAILFLAAACRAPGVLVRIFARGFDEKRLVEASWMLLLLAPFGAANFLRSVMEAWALHLERYTLPNVLGSLYNVLAIPLLLLFLPFLGAYALAATDSIVVALLATLTFFVLGDFPLRFAAVPWRRLLSVGRDALFCLGMVGSSTLYLATDLYFASGLGEGTVSAINYSSFLFKVPRDVIVPILFVFLAKSSKSAARGGGGATEETRASISIAWGYFLPFGVLMAASARPIVDVFLGHGAFDAHAVALTSACVTAYAVVFPVSVIDSITGRYIQAHQKLHIAVGVSYSFATLNALLDWLFAPLLGAAGIVLATSGVTVGITVAYGHLLLRNVWTKDQLISMTHQTLLGASWGIPLFFWAQGTTWGPLFASVPLGLTHLLLAERMGFLKDVPEAWRPVAMARYFWNNLRAFVGR